MAQSFPDHRDERKSRRDGRRELSKLWRLSSARQQMAPSGSRNANKRNVTKWELQVRPGDTMTERDANMKRACREMREKEGWSGREGSICSGSGAGVTAAARRGNMHVMHIVCCQFSFRWAHVSGQRPMWSAHASLPRSEHANRHGKTPQQHTDIWFSTGGTRPKSGSQLWRLTFLKRNKNRQSRQKAYK